MTDEQTTTETARGRVRRMLIEPAIEAGMRFKKGTPEAEQKRALDRICDDLAYLGDAALAALLEWLLRNGEGSARCFWPKPVSLIGVAHSYEPRRLEELPRAASWFASRAGLAALQNGNLVATFLWWEKRLRPPRDERELRMITERSETLVRMVEVTEDKLHRGFEPGAHAREELRWYRGLEARARAMVQAGIDKRQAEAGDAA
ncbi:hypothetical protein [Pseudooceanicola nanhaiensis]|uniref:hypothetical protein n=1 Tax=Pseudooceanicola nanhaiensis TaxID=375761 RepID=UPI001CD1F749|nr:hypothetical protein [Pseudooceanicola nanhaiensis]MCA0919697.1 hypothetical protein [Pseudooceanicola nanhaiensis]